MVTIKVVKQSRKTVQEEITVMVEVDTPTSPKYYRMVDNGNFFPRGVVLFAILPKYKGTENNYMLYEIESGNQKSTDFVLTKDCRQPEWLETSEAIRRTALAILMGERKDFEEINSITFLRERDELLNKRLIEFMEI
jgi:hypothetical protein